MSLKPFTAQSLLWTSEISNLLNVTWSCAEKPGWRRVSVGFIWFCSALLTVSIFYRCVLICSGKKIKTNNKTNSKQAKPTKQTRENSNKLFLTALSFFLIYVLQKTYLRKNHVGGLFQMLSGRG